MHYARVFLNALERLDAIKPLVTSQQLRSEREAPRGGEDQTALRAELGLPEDPVEVSGDGSDFVGAGRGRILPPPSWCGGWRFCDGAGDYRCANTYYPLAGKDGSRLLDMVSERTPVVNGDKRNLTAAPTVGHWAVTLNEDKPTIFGYLRQPNPPGMHKPIDMKWVLVGDQQSGPIEFEFETKGSLTAKNAGPDAALFGSGIDSSVGASAHSRVVVCRGETVERVRLHDEKRVKFWIDGEITYVIRPVQHHFFNGGACVFLAAQVGVGHHTLRVEPMTMGKELVSVSHVIYPA